MNRDVIICQYRFHSLETFPAFFYAILMILRASLDIKVPKYFIWSICLSLFLLTKCWSVVTHCLNWRPLLLCFSYSIPTFLSDLFFNNVLQWERTSSLNPCIFYLFTLQTRVSYHDHTPMGLTNRSHSHVWSTSAQCPIIILKISSLLLSSQILHHHDHHRRYYVVDAITVYINRHSVQLYFMACRDNNGTKRI